MSAGDRWHEGELVRGGDPILPQAILFWMRRQESEGQTAFPWEPDPEAAVRPEPAPDGSRESEEVLAHLLRAIENTDIAARLRSVALPGNGHASGCVFEHPAESAQAGSVLWAPPEPDAGRSEPAPGTAQESSEAVANLPRAIQSAEVAAKLEGIPQAESAEPAEPVCSSPAEEAAEESQVTSEGGLSSSPPGLKPADFTQLMWGLKPPSSSDEGLSADWEAAEFPATLPQEPQTDASAYLETAPNEASKSGESFAVASDHTQSIDADLNLEGITPRGDWACGEAASSEPAEIAEAASVLKPFVAAPHHAAFRPQNRQARRVSRRRSSDWQRSDYLLSIAAPAMAPPPRAPETEPEPTEAAEAWAAAEPVPVIATDTAAELERLSTAEPESAAETSIPPAKAEDDMQKAPVLERPILERPILARLGTGIGGLAATGDLINEGLDRAEMHLETWFQKWFGPPDPRRSMRVDEPPLVAYHWIVDVPQALKIANIGAGGLYLVTQDRWSEGNIVSMTLQRTDKDKESAESWIAVDFLVMRWCEDGMAGAFMPSAPGLAHTVAGRAGNCADKKTLERFVARLVKASVEQDRELNKAPRQTSGAACLGEASPAGM